MAAWFQHRRLRQQVCDLRPLLFRTAFAWTHDAALADDLTQEAMMKAISRLKSLNDEGALKAWVFRIMTNCYRDWGRKQRDLLDVDSIEIACDDCPEQRAERDRVVTSVRAAMEHLSVDHRQVVALVDLEGFAYAEVAEILQVPIGTVMSRLSRARMHLKRLLLADGDLETPEMPDTEEPPRSGLRLIRGACA